MNTNQRTQNFIEDGVVTVDDIQYEAMGLLDRKLTEDELSQVIDLIYENYRFLLPETIHKVLENKQ
jgi:hypothetical protein